jgi:hypothetical protein
MGNPIFGPADVRTPRNKRSKESLQLARSRHRNSTTVAHANKGVIGKAVDHAMNPVKDAVELAGRKLLVPKVGTMTGQRQPGEKK